MKSLLRFIQFLLRWLEAEEHRLGQQASLAVLSFLKPGTNQPFLSGGYIMLTLKDGESRDFTISFKTAKGKPAKVDPNVAPVWSNSNEAALQLTIGADGASGSVLSLDAGNAQIRGTFDADLGDGVRTIECLADIECLSGEAVTAEIEFSLPV